MTADPAPRPAGPGTILDVPTVAAHGRAVLDEVGDPVVARAIVLLSDGLYAHAALSSDVLGRVTGGTAETDDGDGVPEEDLAFRGPRPGDDVDDLLRLLDELVALRRASTA